MEVKRDDMEFIKDALNTARFKSECEDVVESYRQMDVRGKSSPLTKHLERAADLIESYFVEEEVEEEEDVVSE